MYIYAKFAHTIIVYATMLCVFDDKFARPFNAYAHAYRR